MSPVTTEVRFNKQAYFDAVRTQLVGASRATERVAYDLWQQIVPVDTGLLEASFKTNVSNTRDTVMIVLRAGEPGAGFGTSEREMGSYNWLKGEIRRKRPTRMGNLPEGAYYAYWVEVGTSRMAPRAPLRATADALLSVLFTFITERATTSGLSVETDFEGNMGADWLFRAALPAHTRQGALHERFYGNRDYEQPTIVLPGVRRTRSGGVRRTLSPLPPKEERMWPTRGWR